MKLTVRKADPSEDRDGLLELLSRHFEDWGGRAKFDWLYLRNPLGQARVWVLEDEARGVVGLSSAFPRKFKAQEREMNAWVLGDFCVEKDLRVLGPAIALQRAACEAVDRGEADLWYDFPSRSMLAVYARMGLRPSGELARCVRPLRVDRLVTDKLDDGAIGKGLGSLGTGLLSMRDLFWRRDSSVSVEEGDEGFEFFEALPRQDHGIRLDRSAAYLNWRYRTDPRGSASVLLARKEGTPSGALVFRSREDDVTVLDLLGISEETVLRELVRSVVEIARSRKAEKVIAVLSEGHRWFEAFGRLGFSRRDGAPFVVYARAGLLDPQAAWSLTSGDRDP